MKRPHGIQVKSAKLTEAQVKEIRRRYAAYQENRPKQILEEYGIAQETFRQIVKRESWRHV